MINIVLFEPEIPPNTGNIIRLAANTGAQLHLVQPLGFDLEAKKLRRAGLDYHDLAGVRLHQDWAALRKTAGRSRLLGITTRGPRRYSEIRFQDNDYLVFGPETRGLPGWLRAELGPERLLRIPMRPGSRSLNLGNAVAVLVYEAWQQLEFAGGA